jgi:hypothetical protein
MAGTSGAALFTYLQPLPLLSLSKGGGQEVIELFHVAAHERLGPERAQGLGPRLGLAGWGFFVHPFELRKVRPRRVFLGRHRSVSAGTIFADLTPFGTFG